MLEFGLWAMLSHGLIFVKPDVVCLRVSGVCLAAAVGIVGLGQVPAPPVRKTPALTWVSASSSGRTTPATAP